VAEEPETPRPFDVRTISDLVRLMSEHDLAEIDLRWGDERIRLRRGQEVAHTTAAPVQPAASAAPPAAPAANSGETAAAPEKPAKKLLEIRSPTVGTFYSQRKPEEPAFVKVGDRVTPATVVCLIEAMKVFNEVTADVAGVVAEVCVENKQFVEYNTVLFRVDPSA
jgi:acetyl-CoA carboxylase biotin carboxyl carrier protein